MSQLVKSQYRRLDEPGFNHRQGQEVSSSKNVQTDSGEHPAPCSRGTTGFAPHTKRSVR